MGVLLGFIPTTIQYFIWKVRFEQYSFLSPLSNASSDGPRSVLLKLTILSFPSFINMRSG